jgi:hypothetical protein
MPFALAASHGVGQGPDVIESTMRCTFGCGSSAGDAGPAFIALPGGEVRLDRRHPELDLIGDSRAEGFTAGPSVITIRIA